MATSGFAALVRGAHWSIAEEEALVLADAYVKVGKRLEPYMPAVAAKLGPLAIVGDILAAGAVTYIVVKPRLDADRQLAELRALHASGAPAVAPPPALVRVEPAGVHGASATLLDGVRRQDGAVEDDSITVGGTDPHLIERTAELAQEVGITPGNVVELRHAMGEDGPLLDAIAPGIIE